MRYVLNSNFRNNEFELMTNDKYFVDKTELITKINELWGLKDRFVCITRPIRRDTEIMATLLEETHDINIPVIKYNDENSLTCVVMLAYLSARTKYKIIREGQQKPAFILELKVNSSPEEALQQIKEKKYALALEVYSGEKLAVGISWNKETKAHKILIEDVV